MPLNEGFMTPEVITEHPPLLAEIIREVEKLDDEEKRKLLVQLRKSEILNKVKNLDSVAGTEKANAMTDDAVNSYLSEQRKLRYEQSKA